VSIAPLESGQAEKKKPAAAGFFEPLRGQPEGRLLR